MSTIDYTIKNNKIVFNFNIPYSYPILPARVSLLKIGFYTISFNFFACTKYQPVTEGSLSYICFNIEIFGLFHDKNKFI